MKIVCGSCSAKYTVSDDKVQGKSVKVKCRKCGAVIIVSPNGEVRTEGGAPAPSVTYTVSVSETDQRSMTLQDVVAAYNEGVIDAETFVWAEGMDDWAALKDVDAIVDALHVAAQGDQPASVAAPAPYGGGLESTMAMSEGSGMASYEAALAAQRAQAQATVAQAPVAQAPLAQAPVVQTSPSSFGDALGSTVAMESGLAGSLFGGGGGAALASPGASLFTGGTGSMFSNISSGAAATSAPKNEENSAIFSLNTLTSKAASGPAKKASHNEDSGLIDLRALASSVNSGTEIGMAPAAPYSDGGLFSIPAPPPPAPAVAAAPMAPPQVVEVAKPASKGLIFGLGGLVVVLVGAVIYLATRPGPALVEANAAATTAVAAPATATAAATATAVADATPSPSATADADAAASAAAAAGTAPSKPAGGTAVAAAPKTAVAAPPPKAAAATPPPPPPPPPAAAKTSTGGCRSDDLMCLMRAGAGKKKK